MIRERYYRQRCQGWSLSETVDRGGWREMLWTGVLKAMIKEQWQTEMVREEWGPGGSQGVEPEDISVKDDQREKR